MTFPQGDTGWGVRGSGHIGDLPDCHILLQACGSVHYIPALGTGHCFCQPPSPPHPCCCSLGAAATLLGWGGPPAFLEMALEAAFTGQAQPLVVVTSGYLLPLVTHRYHRLLLFPLITFMIISYFCCHQFLAGFSGYFYCRLVTCP